MCSFFGDKGRPTRSLLRSSITLNNNTTHTHTHTHTLAHPPAKQTVRPDDKLAACVWLVREMLPQDQSTVVFVSTRHHAEFLHTLLAREGVEAAIVFGAMDQVRETPRLGAGLVGRGRLRQAAGWGVVPLPHNQIQASLISQPTKTSPSHQQSQSITTTQPVPIYA